MDRPAVQRPLLLIDVDGVLSLFGFPADDPPPGRLVFVDGLPHWLSEQAGMLLNGVAELFEPVWCTGWEDRAPEHLPHLLGLRCRPFPFLRFALADSERHWKLDAIDAYAGAERPLAWIDDGHDERTAQWAARRPGPTLLVTTDPAVGLTSAQAAELSSWASERGVIRAM